MKFKLITILASGIFASLSFAGSNSVCTNYPGAYICENGKVENINGTYGSVTLDNIEVNGDVKGNIGALIIKKSKLKQIKGNIGNFLSDYSILEKIEGNVGAIQLKKTTLKEIDAHTPNVELNNSTVDKITMNSKQKKIKINVKNKSIINGDIYFSENFGNVCIDDSSEVKGNVINGKIIRGSC